MSPKRKKQKLWVPLNVRECQDFGELLRRSVELNGVTVDALCEATGFPPDTMQNYMSGCHIINKENAVKFAGILRLPESELEWRAEKDNENERERRY